MNFAWTDIETTGLNAAEEEILEVSVVVTDAHTLEEKGRFHSLVGPRFHGENDQVFDSFESWFDTWDDWPKAAHTENGLVEDLRIAWEEGSLKSLGKVEDELACFFAEHNGDDRKSLYIAGNSVKFDFGFFEQKMPKVLEHTHYRVADVSSTRIQMQVITGIDFEYPKKKAHRAGDDILESIEEYKHVWRQFKRWCQGADPVDVFTLPISKE